MGEGQAFGKPATAMLDIASGAGGATALIYRLTIAGESPVTYSAGATYAFDTEGRMRGSWADSYGAERPIAGGVMVTASGQRRCRDRALDLCAGRRR